MLTAVISTALLAAALQATPAKKAPAFDAKDYPAGKFQITRKEFPHGDLTIRVIEVKNQGYTMKPDTCRAWLEVRSGSRLLRRLYYDDFEPVGFSYGIFVPKNQPVPGYFVAVKEGDYDGRLLLVGKDGAVTDLMGGFFFLTTDKRYLVSEYASDESALTVFDVQQNREVLSRKDLPEIGSWYQDTSGYFFREYGKTDRAMRVDFTTGQITEMKVNEDTMRGAQKIHYDFDPRNKKDCMAEPQ